MALVVLRTLTQCYRVELHPKTYKGIVRATQGKELPNQRSADVNMSGCGIFSSRRWISDTVSVEKPLCTSFISRDGNDDGKGGTGNADVVEMFWFWILASRNRIC